MADKIKDLEAVLNLVWEELERLIREAREEGAKAYLQGDTATFYEADACSKKLQKFADRFEVLCRDWQTASEKPEPRQREPRQRESQSATPRARPGELLPEKEYVFPILHILQEHGGALKKAEVLVELEPILREALAEEDWEIINDGQIRWKNRAAWVRNYLAEGGLLSRDAPRGVWEITPRGREELAAGDLEMTWKRLMMFKSRRRQDER